MAKYICAKLGRGCSNHKTYYDQWAKCEHCGSHVVLTQANELER
jgi:DNA-directed RNA polymerase subunit RPC12/RpoP